MLGLFIVLIMVTSGIGYMIGSSAPDTEIYEGHALRSENGLWTLKYNDEPVSFTYFPAYVDDIEFTQTTADAILDSQAIITAFHPDDPAIETIEQIRFELQTSIPRLFGMYSGAGISAQSSQYDLPIISCNNASSAITVIMIESANSTGFEYDDNCLRMKGQSAAELRMLKDRMMYGLTGVIK